MPISVHGLVEETRPLAIPMFGDILNIRYYPNGYTPELEEQVNEAERLGQTSRGMVIGIHKMLVSWDLLENEGDDHTYPLEEEAMMKLPVKLLTEVTRAIGKDQTPDPRSGSSFGGT